MKDKTEFTTNDVAKVCNTNESFVRDWFRSRRLNGTKKNGRWVVSREELIRFIKAYGFSLRELEAN